jgi:type II secretory pathway pseudopilin PulG
MERKVLYRPFRHLSQTGMSLLETLVALAILLIASIGILTVAALAMSTTENQGHLAARTAEYAQDKMEQLTSLAWGDQVSNTTVFPTVSSGGTGLAIGGSADPDASATGYVDYLDISGQPCSSGANWYYIRAWQISNPAWSNYCVVNGASVPCLKEITVTTKVRRQVGAPQGALPQSTLVSLKTTPF